ncbi:MAG: DUF885 domain-containing protein [Bacteroidota bacterium]
MKYHKLLGVVCLLLVMGCQQKKSEFTENTVEKDNQELASLLKEYYEERLQFYPLDATFSGDARYNDTLANNISELYREKLRSFYSKYKTELSSFNKTQLSENDVTSYDVLLWECNINLGELSYPTHLTPVDQFWTPQLIIGQFASGASAQPFETVKDYEDWLSRVDDFVVWCDTAIMNMKKGMGTGWVLPQSLIKKVIPQMKAWDHGVIEEHHFFSPIHLMPESFSKEDKGKLRTAYSSMVGNKIIPIFEKFTSFLENEYLPAGRETSGISAVPDGEEFYQHRIKLYTTTDMTADEIFELGKSEVVRIREEMEKVKEQVGFEGDLKAFFDHVRTKPELMSFTDPQEVIDNFEAIHEKMKPELSKQFDLVPKAAFEVRRTEAFREASASAEYNPGSLDGTRPGVFYVPIPDVKAYNVFSDESLFLHEAIPGHHYQISLQQENENLPDFRKTLWYSAYGEGWALYSESLGKELGLYDDPYQYFGALSAEMHRAIRLVVDAGMHSKGWTREEAIQYSLENEAESEASITSEIERYMAGPGQALSYKIGQLKIRSLRTEAKEKLGEQFDIKIYHNIVLEPGCIPLALLEDKVNDWVGSVGENL